MVKKSVQSKSAPKKTYAQMTRNQRKVAIAQDVIKQLHVLRIKRNTGYVVPMDQNGDRTDAWDIKALLDFGVTPQQIAHKAKETCTLCARGAMMLCKVDKFNNFGFEDLNYLDDISDDTTTEALEDAFDEEELGEIENAFESSWTHWAEIKDDKDRLQAIMQCIIDHKGVFKPEVEYTVS